MTFWIFSSSLVFSFLRKRFIVVSYASPDLLAIEHHHLVGIRLVGRYLAFAVQPPLCFVFSVGIIALLLVIFDVILRHLPDEFADLVLRNCSEGERCGRSGCGGRQTDWRRR